MLDSPVVLLLTGLLCLLAVGYFVYRYSKTHRTGLFPVLLGLVLSVILSAVGYVVSTASSITGSWYYAGAELLSGILPFGAGGFTYYFTFFDIFKDVVFVALFALVMHRFLQRRLDSTLLFGVSFTAITFALQSVAIGVLSFLSPASAALSWNDPAFPLIEIFSIGTGSLFFACISVLIMRALMRKSRRELVVACACYPALNLVNSLFLSFLFTGYYMDTFGQTALIVAAVLFNLAAILCIAFLTTRTLSKKELHDLIRI